MEEQKGKGKLMGYRIFVVVTIIAIIWISYGNIKENYDEKKVAKEQEIFNNGKITGAQIIILQIAQQSQNCQIIPLVIGNATLNLVNVDCIRNQN